MFDLYDYIKDIAPDVPELQKVYRTHGLSTLDEMLNDVRNNPACCVVVQEGADGRLDLRARRHNTAYHTFWVMTRAKLNDNDSRLAAKRLSMFAGVRLIDRMRADSDDFGQRAYGLDDENVQYAEIGPIGQNYYGYSFSFTVAQGIAKYVPPPVYPDGTYMTDEAGNLIQDNDNNLITE